MVRHLLQVADELGEELRALADGVLQVARDLAGEGEEDVRVLAELARQGGDRLLTRRRLLAALDLAQVGGLDAGALGDLAEREGPVGGPFRLALLPDVVAEGVHVWSEYYTVHGWVSRGAVGDGAAFSRGHK